MAGFTYPKEYGGQGADAWQEAIYDDEAAGYEASSGFIRSTIMMLGPTLMAFGTEEQKRELLPRLLSGEDAWCQLFSEPGAGSDLAGLACRAERDGDEFVVTGRRCGTRPRSGATTACCSPGPTPTCRSTTASRSCSSTWTHPASRCGRSSRPPAPRTSTRCSSTTCACRCANVLGDIDNGWPAARTVMANESAMIGGGTAAARSRTCCCSRRSSTAPSDPVARQRLMECYVNEKTLNLFAERIMGAIRRRERPPVDPSILKLSIALNKAVTGQVAGELAGAAALLTDDEIGQWVSSEMLSRYGISIGGGTNEVQRNNLAERALGLPKEPTVPRDTPWSQLLRS